MRPQLALCTNAALGVEGALARRRHATAFSVLGAASSPAKLKEKAAVGSSPKNSALQHAIGVCRSQCIGLPLLPGRTHHSLKGFFERPEKNWNVGLTSVVRRLTDILAIRRDERQ